MARIVTYNVALDVRDDTVTYVDVKQYDDRTRQLIIKVTDKEKNYVYNLNEYTVYCKYKTADGRPLLGTVTMNNDGTATLVLDDNMLYKKGLAKVELVLMQGNFVLSTMPFYVKIVSSAYQDSDILQQADLSTLFGVLKQIADDADIINTALQKVGLLMQRIAEAEAIMSEWETDENTRKQNEIGRVDAEEDRVEEFNNLIQGIRDGSEQVQYVLDLVDEILSKLDELDTDETILHSEDIADSDEVDDMIDEVFDGIYEWDGYMGAGANFVTYGLELVGNKISLVKGSTNTSITLPNDNDTHYGLSMSDGVLSLVENGENTMVEIPDEDTNTKYGLLLDGNTLSLIENGNVNSVTLPSNINTGDNTGSGNNNDPGDNPNGNEESGGNDNPSGDDPNNTNPNNGESGGNTGGTNNNPDNDEPGQDSSGGTGVNPDEEP